MITLNRDTEIKIIDGGDIIEIERHIPEWGWKYTRIRQNRVSKASWLRFIRLIRAINWDVSDHETSVESGFGYDLIEYTIFAHNPENPLTTDKQYLAGWLLSMMNDDGLEYARLVGLNTGDHWLETNASEMIAWNRWAED